MTAPGFSAKQVQRWLFTVGDVVVPLPADLVGRVKVPVPNRADRRRARKSGGAP